MYYSCMTDDSMPGIVECPHRDVMVFSYSRRAHLALMKTLSWRMSPSLGRWKSAGRRASQYMLARALPMAAMNWTCSGSHVSRFAERTFVKWTPIDLKNRCMLDSLNIGYVKIAVCHAHVHVEFSA